MPSLSSLVYVWRAVQVSPGTVGVDALAGFSNWTQEVIDRDVRDLIANGVIRKDDSGKLFPLGDRSFEYAGTTLVFDLERRSVRVCCGGVENGFYNFDSACPQYKADFVAILDEINASEKATPGSPAKLPKAIVFLHERFRPYIRDTVRGRVPLPE